MKKQPEHNRKNVPPQDTAKAPKSAVSRSMRTRAIVLAALFVLVGFGAVVYNLYQLQIVQHDELAARAETQQLADETITPNRGVIYDSDMKVLARSNKVWTVVASPRDMANSGTNINDVAVKLAELLELDAQSILESFRRAKATISSSSGRSKSRWRTPSRPGSPSITHRTREKILLSRASAWCRTRSVIIPTRRWPPRSSAL